MLPLLRSLPALSASSAINACKKELDDCDTETHQMQVGFACTTLALQILPVLAQRLCWIDGQKG